MHEFRSPFRDELLRALVRHSTAMKIARALGDQLATFIAAAHARHALQALGIELIGRRDVIALIEHQIARHDALLATRPLYAGADEVSRIARWAAARHLATAVRKDDPDLFELSVRDREFGALDCEALYIAESWFQSVSMRGAVFDGATVENCDFWECDLARTSWSGAHVVRCVFQSCTLTDAVLDDATFIDCVFYGSEFDGRDERSPATARRTQFTRCDLRQTSWRGRVLDRVKFVRCRVHGMTGRPHVTAIEIDRPDLTRAGDGSCIGTECDVLGLWKR